MKIFENRLFVYGSFIIVSLGILFALNTFGLLEYPFKLFCLAAIPYFGTDLLNLTKNMLDEWADFLKRILVFVFMFTGCYAAGAAAGLFAAAEATLVDAGVSIFAILVIWYTLHHRRRLRELEKNE